MCLEGTSAYMFSNELRLRFRQLRHVLLRSKRLARPPRITQQYFPQRTPSGFAMKWTRLVALVSLGCFFLMAWWVRARNNRHGMGAPDYYLIKRLTAIGRHRKHTSATAGFSVPNREEQLSRLLIGYGY